LFASRTISSLGNHMKQLLHCILAAWPTLLLTLISGCDFLETPTKAHAVPNQDGKYVQFFFDETGDTLNVEAAVVTGARNISLRALQRDFHGDLLAELHLSRWISMLVEECHSARMEVIKTRLSAFKILAPRYPPQGARSHPGAVTGALYESDIQHTWDSF